jgi:hypothetical protein
MSKELEAIVAEMLSIAPTCESDWDAQLREWADRLSTQAAEGWRDIATAPAEEEVWLFDPDTDPQQYAAIYTEGGDGPYWRPKEELVAEMLDYELTPTHWRPLPSPPPPPSDTKGDV